MKKLVIIGGGASGMTLAAQIIKFTNEYNVTVIEKGDKFGWAGCPTPYYIGGVANDNCLGSSKDIFEEKGINILENRVVEFIDETNQVVKLNDDSTLKYDKLVLCMGAKQRELSIKGLDYSSSNTFKLTHIDDAVRIKSYVTSKNVKHATVCGAGFVGLEVAENLVQLGIKVTIIERESSLFPSLNQDLLKGIYKELDKLGIELVLNTTINEVISDRGNVSSIVTSNSKIDTDFLLISTGVTPNIDILKSTSINLVDEHFVSVNDCFETNVKNIYALGDLIKVNHQILNKSTYAPLGDVADKQAIFLAKRLAGKDIKYKGVYNAFATQVGTRKLAHVGLSIDSALKHGYDAEFTVVSGVTKTGSFKNQGGGMMHLVYNKKDMTVIGATMVGDEAIAQFVDQVSIAIYSKLSIEDLLHIDYCYSPTNSSVWNPLLAAYRRIMKKDM